MASRPSRGGQSSRAASLRNDPRARRDAQGRLTRNDLDTRQLDLDRLDRLRLTVANDIQPLASDASLADVVSCLNELLSRLKS